MYLLLFIMAIIVIYIYSFKENFTQEKIDKVAPIFIVGTIIVFILTVLSAVMSTK